MSITKKGPFKISKITDDYPLYGRLIAQEIETVSHLPNFSKDKGLFIFSDFGGEHNGADFCTYSFLICSSDKRCVFEEETKKVRTKYSLNSPWKEYNFKDLRYGPIKRALSDFLDISDKFIHGLLLTLSIDKSIPSVFGLEKNETHSQIATLLKENDLGDWKGKDAEKVIRVCIPLAIIMSVTAYNGQKFLWLCDNDSINQDGKKRDFSNTQNILNNVLNMYSDNEYEIYGFAKPFERDAGTNDLLSLTDFAAGTIHDILQSEIKNKAINLSDEKIKLVKWMASESRFLIKVNLVITKQDDGDLEVGKVQLTPKI